MLIKETRKNDLEEKIRKLNKQKEELEEKIKVLNRPKEEIEETNTEKKSKEETNKKQKNGTKIKTNKYIKIIKPVLDLFFVGVLIAFFILYGPFDKFRVWYITTAMTTMSHQYLATWFYSDQTISHVLANNKVVEVEGITNTSLISTEILEDTSIKEANTPVVYANEYERAVLEKDDNHPEYKIINIEDKKYKGYLAVVYDASKVKTLVTSKLNVAGQFVTTMAKENNAVLAINGGGFKDVNQVGTGGEPLGLTFSNGKLITNKSYGGVGGLIGFDNENILVLGKMTAKQAQDMGIRDAVTCGPYLILNGEASKVVGNGGWGNAPRTAIGQRRDGIVLMLVIEGRKIGMPGANMEDLLNIMQRYGAYNASALDGGTSTVMVENYEMISDPVNASGEHRTRPIATAFGLILEDE